MIRHSKQRRPHVAHSATESIPGLAEIWLLLRRHARWIAIGAVAGIALAGLYCLLSAPVYKSEAKLFVKRKDPGLPQVSNIGEAETIADEDLLDTLAEMLVSERVVEAALMSSGMDEAESVQKALEDDQTAVNYVIDNLTVTTGGEGSTRGAQVVTISFRHTNAADCQTILQSLINSYRRFLVDMTQQEIDGALTLVEQRRDMSKEQLDEIQQDFTDFLESAPLLWDGNKTENVNGEQIQRLQEQFALIREVLIDTKASYRIIIESGKGPSPRSDIQRVALIPEKYLAQLARVREMRNSSDSERKEEAAELELLRQQIKLADLLAEFGRDNHKVKRVRRAIEQLEGFLGQQKEERSEELEPREVVAAYIDFLESELSGLRIRKDATQAELQQEIADAKAVVQFQTEHDRRLGDLKRQQESYALLDERVKHVRMARNHDGYITEDLAYAGLGEKAGPGVALFLAVGAILGMCSAVGFAVIKDQTAGIEQAEHWSAPVVADVASDESRFETECRLATTATQADTRS